MRLLLIFFISVLSLTAHAASVLVRCDPTQILQWPMNPQIQIRPIRPPVFEMQITRMYYGMMKKDVLTVQKRLAQSQLGPVEIFTAANGTELMIRIQPGQRQASFKSAYPALSMSCD